MSVETQLWALKEEKPRVYFKPPQPMDVRLAKATKNVEHRMKKVGK